MTPKNPLPSEHHSNDVSVGDGQKEKSDTRLDSSETMLSHSR